MASVRARSKDVGNDREFLIASKGPAGGAGSPSLDGARSLRWPLWLKIALAALAITGVAMLFMGFKSVRVEPYQHDSFITVKGTQVRGLLGGTRVRVCVCEGGGDWVLLLQ